MPSLTIMFPNQGDPDISSETLQLQQDGALQH